MKKIICVVGPTASGKTALAVELAKELSGEVVSCDSMQIYRGLDIGTAKPTQTEMQGIPHHMIDVCDPWEVYSVARYVEEASLCMDQILERGNIPILAGGTGLYMDSVLKGLHFSKGVGDGILRERLEKMYSRRGANAMHRLLGRVDGAAAARIHPNDRKRVLRALEVRFSEQKTITEHNEQSRSLPARYRALTFGLDFQDRSLLYDRINRRVDAMFKGGLVDEVHRILPSLHPNSGAFQAIGYKEIIAAIREGRSAATANEPIKLSTRRYAKRQLTWFRKTPTVCWFQRDLLLDSDILTISTEKAREFLYNDG